ncbi:MAG: hypothetical protein AB8B80_09110 [Marinicellaceae bacterium]
MNQLKNIPIWFYIAAILAILWNALGVLAYLNMAFMSTEDFMQLPETQRTMELAMPQWAKAAFAIAVFAGFIGSVLLALKKSIAFFALILSFVAVLVQQYNFIYLMSGFDFIDAATKGMTISISVVAALLVWLAYFAQSKNWIK